jgi:hypothetical protein
MLVSDKTGVRKDRDDGKNEVCLYTSAMSEKFDFCLERSFTSLLHHDTSYSPKSRILIGQCQQCSTARTKSEAKFEIQLMLSRCSRLPRTKSQVT